MGKTLFDKIWDAHVIRHLDGGRDVLYIDRHYIHEVTSPVAFLGLRNRGITVARPDKTVATADHNVPTVNQHLPINDPESRGQLEAFAANCEANGIEHFSLGHPKQGVVHIVGPELGYTLPGMTIVCGDSHTSTHGAFGAVAFGVGTSEVEMVFASQCILQPKPRKMRITVNGRTGKGVTAKDVILYIISQISAAGGTGHFIEFAGEAITSMTMEERMTVCNMAIECGARGGLIAPDRTTFDYVRGRENAPKGEEFDKAVARWKELYTDPDAVFDKEYTFDAADIEPMVTYGTNPGMGVAITGTIPSPEGLTGGDRISFDKSLEYMGFAPGEPMTGKPVDYVFVGSCTNGRIEDFRQFAAAVKGCRKAPNVTAWIVPGSKLVEAQCREEGLDKILAEAGFELRQPGCSACLAMNDDKIPAGKYSVSTSNRNFEGRQGPGARTLLAGPLVAAAAAVCGTLQDPRVVFEL
ncbi:MAG: 3-isopropylmalate dehydratase large subunit [Rikenellaceae bacterium]|nr:3-isopropylmalate dehydratase large subunit [Rikenellaceae bacterium]